MFSSWFFFFTSAGKKLNQKPNLLRISSYGGPMHIKATADIVIKYLMGEPDAEPILRAFINAVFTDAGFPTISQAEVVSPFNQKQNLEDKESILDIRAVAADGRIINVEIQSYQEEHFINRSLYYYCRIYGDQLVESEDYSSLAPTVCINILEYRLFEHDKVHTVYMLKEQESNEVLTDHEALHFIELSKIESKTRDGNLQDWLVYFRMEGKEDTHSSREVEILTDKNKDIQAAHKRYNEFVSDEQQRLRYEARFMGRKDQLSRENQARREGREEGKAAGQAEGRKEALFEVARKMIEAGSSMEFIMKSTGLSEEEIAKLVNG
jgi:predicted transposase/invertase (TIGR01784 family)